MFGLYAVTDKHDLYDLDYYAKRTQSTKNLKSAQRQSLMTLIRHGCCDFGGGHSGGDPHENVDAFKTSNKGAAAYKDIFHPVLSPIERGSVEDMCAHKIDTSKYSCGLCSYSNGNTSFLGNVLSPHSEIELLKTSTDNIVVDNFEDVR